MKRGSEFEKLIENRIAYYESKRLLVLRKTDPPTRVVGFNRIIYLSNPFVDWAGSWTECGGRAVFIEAKETSKLKLGMGESGSSGVTTKQLRALRIWHAAGAVSAVLWKSPERTYFVPMSVIERIIRESGMKHIKACEIPKSCFCGSKTTLNLISAMRLQYNK